MYCNPYLYQNIHKLLTTLATLPITTASAERSFSTTLCRLKAYLRSTMSSERLTMIALLNIHPDIEIELVITALLLSVSVSISFCNI